MFIWKNPNPSRSNNTRTINSATSISLEIVGLGGKTCIYRAFGPYESRDSKMLYQHDWHMMASSLQLASTRTLELRQNHCACWYSRPTQKYFDKLVYQWQVIVKTWTKIMIWVNKNNITSRWSYLSLQVSWYRTSSSVANIFITRLCTSRCRSSYKCHILYYQCLFHVCSYFLYPILNHNVRKNILLDALLWDFPTGKNGKTRGDISRSVTWGSGRLSCMTHTLYMMNYRMSAQTSFTRQHKIANDINTKEKEKGTWASFDLDEILIVSTLCNRYQP